VGERLRWPIPEPAGVKDGLPVRGKRAWRIRLGRKVTRLTVGAHSAARKPAVGPSQVPVDDEVREITTG